MACIDEVHCICEWAHNFRPSYLRLNTVLRNALNIQNILGLTATATLAMERDIRQSLEIPEVAHALMHALFTLNNTLHSILEIPEVAHALMHALFTLAYHYTYVLMCQGVISKFVTHLQLAFDFEAECC